MQGKIQDNDHSQEMSDNLGEVLAEQTKVQQNSSEKEVILQHSEQRDSNIELENELKQAAAVENEDEKQKSVNQQKKSDQNRTKGSLKVKVKISKSKPKPIVVEQKKLSEKQELLVKTRQAQKFRARARSQNSRLQSLKKTNEMVSTHQQQNQQEEQDRKGLRIKQITKRKLQLLQKLKRIDNQLIEAKRALSPAVANPASKLADSQSVYISHKNSSSLSYSRQNKPILQNKDQHSKALEMLEKLNNQKMKRQQRIAEQIKKKQQIQMAKLQQIQSKRNLELQQKKKRKQLLIHRPKVPNRLQINKAKINSEDVPVLSESSVMPTTLVVKTAHNKKSFDEDEFLGKLEANKKNHNSLLTERDNFQTQQTKKQSKKQINFIMQQNKSNEIQSQKRQLTLEDAEDDKKHTKQQVDHQNTNEQKQLQSHEQKKQEQQQNNSQKMQSKKQLNQQVQSPLESDPLPSEN